MRVKPKKSKGTDPTEQSRKTSLTLEKLQRGWSRGLHPYHGELLESCLRAYTAPAPVTKTLSSRFLSDNNPCEKHISYATQTHSCHNSFKKQY